MMNIKLTPLYGGKKETTAWGRLMRRVGKLSIPSLSHDSFSQQGVYHHGGWSSDSAHAFNKLSTYSSCFEEQRGSESQNPFKKIVINGRTL